MSRSIILFATPTVVAITCLLLWSSPILAPLLTLKYAPSAYWWLRVDLTQIDLTDAHHALAPRLGLDDIPELERGAQDPNLKIRTKSLLFLGWLTLPAASEAFARILAGNPHVDARQYAALLLRKSPTIHAVLLAAIETDSSPLVRSASCESLGYMPPSPAAEEVLRKASRDPDLMVRYSAVTAWSAINREAALLRTKELLVSAIPADRSLAVRLFARLKDKSSLPDVIAVARSDGDPRVRISALRALPSLTENFLSELTPFLREENVDIRRAAVELVVANANPKRVDILKSLLDDEKDPMVAAIISKALRQWRLATGE